MDFLLSKYGLTGLFKIDEISGWFDTDSKEEWLESILYQALISGINLQSRNYGIYKETTDTFETVNEKIENNKNYNLDELLVKVISTIKEKIMLLNLKNFDDLEKNYRNVLYKKNTATMFKDSYGVLFMGIIIGISSNGKLQIQLEDDSIKEFGIKEITFL